MQVKTGRMAVAVSAKQTETKTLRANLEQHEKFLKEFGSLFTDFSEYMTCVEQFQSEYGERLEREGLAAFSDAELRELLGNIQEFQGYSAYWGKALKRFDKIDAA